MSLEKKLEAVRTLIEEYNEGVDEKISFEDFEKCLKVAGFQEESELKRLSYEYFLNFLPAVPIGNVTIKPTNLAKKISKIFRGDKKPKTDVEKRVKYTSSKRARTMTVKALIKAFDPEELDSPVAERLVSLSKGKAFIVYDQDGSINVSISANLLNEIKQGYDTRETVISEDGRVMPVYRMDEKRNSLVDENPLYPGRPLRPDGTCDQTGRSYEGIDEETRVLCRLALNTGLIEGWSDIHKTIDLALQGKKELVLFYPSLAKAYAKHEEKDTLPKLKVSLLSGSGSVNIQNGQRV